MLSDQQKLVRELATEKYKVGEKGVVSVGIGYKQIGGEYTDMVAVVIGVKKKLPLKQLAKEEVIGPQVLDMPTDVVEYGEIKALSLTTRMRPCPGGFSVGSVSVTAGTLGCTVRRGTAPGLYILSNAHVLANSGLDPLGTATIQPGRLDGGWTPQDQIAVLSEYVKINFDGQNGSGGKKGKAMWLWKVAKGVPNAIARLVKCPYRLIVAIPNEIPQPSPNLVDAAIALVSNPGDVLQSIQYLGVVNGIRDLVLGDRVKKVGRTTEETHGRVVTVGATVQVSYGEQGTATFADQLVIAANTGEFSAAGDSGGAVLTENDNFLAGLLFAGSPGSTIVNRISNVVSLLGVRL